MLLTKQSQLPLLNSIVEDALNYEVVFIDLFCGAGGVTSGVVRAMIEASFSSLYQFATA